MHNSPMRCSLTHLYSTARFCLWGVCHALITTSGDISLSLYCMPAQCVILARNCWPISYWSINSSTHYCISDDLNAENLIFVCVDVV